MKRNIIYIATFIYSLNVFGQVDLKSFNGHLFFKESWYYAPISRLFFDTIVSYSTYHIHDSIEIEQIAAFNEDKVVELKYLRIKFTKRTDSIFINYFDPIIKKNQTKYFFPINIRDTLLNTGCYRFFVDSFPQENSYKTYLNECNEEPDDIETIYIKDSIMVFNQNIFDCYVIEQFKFAESERGTNLRRKILFSKDLMVPIDLKEYYYFRKWTRGNRKIPKEKWLLTRHLKLIYIDN